MVWDRTRVRRRTSGLRWAQVEHTAADVTAFDLVADLTEVDPAHPRTFRVKGVLDDRACGLVAVQPGEDRASLVA